MWEKCYKMGVLGPVLGQIILIIATFAATIGNLADAARVEEKGKRI